MIDSGRPSLFVVQSPMDLRFPHFCSILQLQSNDHRASAAPELPVRLDKKKDSLVHFTNDFDLNSDPLPAPMTWICSSTKDEFFMVPFLTSDAYQLDVLPLYGLEYNFRTHTYRRMDPPVSLKPYAGCAVNLAGLLYFIAQPYAPFDLRQPKPCIQRYDPVRRFWKTLAPFPMPSNTDIKATAVWYDNILFNMVGRRPEMWAFNVTLNKWYPVIVQDEDNLCYHIVGEAVVRENTIYALKDDPCNSVLALSIQRERNNGRILFTCSLLCEIPVLGMRRISSLYGSTTRETRYLVHLGQGNLCLVQSCELTCSPAVNQTVQVTYMKLEGNNSMIVTDNCVYEFPIEDGLPIHVLSCFSIPEYKTLRAEDQGEGFLFSPFPDNYEPWDFGIPIFNYLNAESGVPSRNNLLLKQTNIIDEQGESRRDRKHTKRQYDDCHSDRNLRVTEGTEDKVRELIDEERVKKRKLQSENNLLTEHKLCLENYIDERTKKIKDLELQLIQEKEESCRITSKYKKFVTAYNRMLHLEGEVKRSEADLERAYEELKNSLTEEERNELPANDFLRKKRLR